MQDFVGKHIDRYRVIERLGVGGMAVVYKAYDTRLDRNVAIKLIRTDEIPTSQFEHLMNRFEREAKAQAGFSHPNIISVYDYGEAQGIPYLVMELIPGGTLKDKLHGLVPWRQALTWIEPIASALSYAHKHGVIHRDVKASNILFNHEGHPILTDFGIAKTLETTDATLTGTGLGVGTPEYMAPEQWQGQATQASDQYSLGVVLYELLTGRRPYTAETPLAVALKQMTEPLPRPRDLVRDIPDTLEKVLFKALAPNPADRFESMEVFQTVLGNLLRDQKLTTPIDLPSQPHVLTPSLESEAETFDVFETPAYPTPQPLVQHPAKRAFPAWAWWAIGGVLLFSCLAIGAGFLLGTDWLIKKPPQGPLAAAPPTSSDLSEIERSTSAVVDSNPQATADEAPPLLISTETSPPSITPTEEPIIEVEPTATKSKGTAKVVYVPAGNFIMGSELEGAGDVEKPSRTVNLDAFWIDVYEVTNADYRQCVEGGICEEPKDIKYFNNPGFEDHPVVFVTWDQANAFCQWAGGRLPTEAEWEKAARGPNEYKYPWGNSTPTCSLANFYDCNLNTTKPVGSYPDGASPYGALDMAGNVWEWVADWSDKDYYSKNINDNPKGPETGVERVLRGGSWYNKAGSIRTSHRYWNKPNGRHESFGFRCAYSHEP